MCKKNDRRAINLNLWTSKIISIKMFYNSFIKLTKYYE